jgi:hypothetical protein
MIPRINNAESMLPCGEALRTFIEQPFISRGDLRDVLRSRGIFISSSIKEDTIPVATCCLFGPLEFERLLECQVNREDNPKQINRLLDWNSQDKLIDSVPDTIDFHKIISDEHSYCKIIGDPTFVPVGQNPDHVKMDYEIERLDYSKSWASSVNNYKGSIELQKIYDGKNVSLVLTHTADETKQLGLKVGKQIENHFESTGRTATGTKAKRILFSDFTNEQRILFFLSLTGNNKTDLLDFKDVTDFDTCPDPQVGNLPQPIKWMEKRVEDIKLKGKNLHETFFIKEKEYHPFLHLHKMDAKFDFSYYAGSGSCTVSFDFVGYSGESGVNAELQTTISGLSLSPQFQQINKNSVKEHILRAIQLFTFEQYQKLSNHSQQN